MLVYDQKERRIFDLRRKEDVILSDGASVCYTLLQDDITKGEKPASTPYCDRTDFFRETGEGLISRELGAQLRVGKFWDGLSVSLMCDREDLSEFGLNLPFNFMGKLNGGGWRNQFLFNSPYTSSNGEISYFYLQKPNGYNLVLAVEGEGAFWKMDYSPYLGGHYFLNLKLLANYDRAYASKRRENRLSFVLLPVGDYSDCLAKMARLYGVPFLGYKKSGGLAGETISLFLYGEADELIVAKNGKQSVFPYRDEYTLRGEGESTLVPCCLGRRGADVTVYAYADLYALYEKSMDAVDLSVVAQTDGNLCEHQCWASALLKFLLARKNELPQKKVKCYEEKLLTLLRVVTETDEKKAVARRTIFAAAHDGLPAYNVYRSKRIQEGFFGVSILLDAYKYFGDPLYYRYAVSALCTLVDHYQKGDGRFEIERDGVKEDYTTVCCPMIPIVDAANYLRGKDSLLSQKFFSSAERMAEFLCARGMSFPTEGGSVRVADTEMEDGSISCTALALLYYCKNVKREERYLAKAKEILDIHDCWVMKSPRCQMYGSTLRWWETQWEGDRDGPALCAGHAWTIWRAEADWLYYFLTGDKAYAIKAANGFMTNLSKIDGAGNSYAIYNVDSIPGGGFHDRADDVVFRLSNKFPTRRDCGLSRYVWARLSETFLSEEEK